MKIKRILIMLLTFLFAFSACKAEPLAEVLLEEISENSILTLEKEEQDSTEENVEGVFLQEEYTEEDQLKYGQGYSTIVVSFKDNELSFEEIEVLKNKWSENENEIVKYSPSKLKNGCIYGEISISAPIDPSYIYGIDDSFCMELFRHSTLRFLENGKVAGELLVLEYNLEAKSYLGHPLINSVTNTTYPIKEDSFVLTEGNQISEVQLDYDSVPKLLEMNIDELKEKKPEIHESDLENVFSGIFYDNTMKKYYVTYDAKYIKRPLYIAVFNERGDYIESIAHEEIEVPSHSERGAILVKSYRLKDGRVLLYFERSDNVAIFNPKNEEIEVFNKSEMAKILLENGYIEIPKRSKNWTIPISEPPFLVEESTTEDKILIMVKENTEKNIEISENYYLVDWEESEDGFQAIFGNMKGYYGDNSESIIANEIIHQPWDYRCIA